MMLDDFLKACGGATLGDLKKISAEPIPPIVTPLHLLTSGPDAGPVPALPAHAGGVRVQWYLGPDLEISVEALAKFEKQGGWVIEPKFDGMWAMLTVGDPANGKPHTLKSRDAKTGFVGGGNSGDLMTTPLPLPVGSILVGELEAASEWATKQFHTKGFRQLHLFDFPLGLTNYCELSCVDRRALLEQVTGTFDEFTASRFPLVPRFTDKFQARYEEWIANGLEGCVLKRATSRYSTVRSDGKTDLWHRCKKRVTEDYVLCGLGKTPGGSLTGLWGLFKKGKLTQVLKANAPKDILQEANVGKVVCEFMGWARFDSGALRHGQFVRIREDKTPEMCVFKETA